MNNLNSNSYLNPFLDFGLQWSLWENSKQFGNLILKNELFNVIRNIHTFKLLKRPHITDNTSIFMWGESPLNLTVSCTTG